MHNLPDPVLHLLDPRGSIRRASAWARREGATSHDGVGTLRHALETMSTPVVVAVDASGGSPDPEEVLPAPGTRSRALVLVVSEDTTVGNRWMDRGAWDFVLLPERQVELEPRLRRLAYLQAELAATRSCARQALHEARNSLNAVFGYTQMLFEDPALTGAPCRSDVEKIVENARLLLSACHRLEECYARPMVHQHCEEAAR